MDEETWRLVLKRIKYQLQALAMPAEVQLRLLPDFVCKAEELANDYDHWCSCLVGNDAGWLTEQQRTLLMDLNRFFDSMSAQTAPNLWTDEALHIQVAWDEIRVMARDALAAFDWSVEEPAEPI